MSEHKDKVKVTPVPIPDDMRARIDAQMKISLRGITAEILVLIREALDHREKRQ